MFSCRPRRLLTPRLSRDAGSWSLRSSWGCLWRTSRSPPNTHVTAWAQAPTWLAFLSVSPSLDFIGVGADVDAGVDVGADADVGAGVGAVGTGADAIVTGFVHVVMMDCE